MTVDKTQQGNKARGFYRGTVLKVNDDGTCKVFVPGIYNNVYSLSADYLPTAYRADPLIGPGTGKDGFYTLPLSGSVVWCFFENEDITKPVYFSYDCRNDTSHNSQFAAVMNKIESGKPEESVGAFLQFGNIDMKLKTDGDFILNSTSNLSTVSTVEIDQTGKMRANAQGSIEIETKQDIAVNANNMSQNINSSVSINTKKTNSTSDLNIERTLNDISKNILGKDSQSTNFNIM